MASFSLEGKAVGSEGASFIAPEVVAFGVSICPSQSDKQRYLTTSGVVMSMYVLKVSVITGIP